MQPDLTDWSAASSPAIPYPHVWSSATGPSPPPLSMPGSMNSGWAGGIESHHAPDNVRFSDRDGLHGRAGTLLLSAGSRRLLCLWHVVCFRQLRSTSCRVCLMHTLGDLRAHPSLPMMNQIEPSNNELDLDSRQTIRCDANRSDVGHGNSSRRTCWDTA